MDGLSCGARLSGKRKQIHTESTYKSKQQSSRYFMEVTIILLQSCGTIRYLDFIDDLLISNLLD